MTYLILKSQINDSKPSYLYHMIIGSGLHIYNLYEFAYTIQIDFPMSKLKCLIYFSFLSENFGSFVVFSANFLYPLIIWPHFHVKEKINEVVNYCFTSEHFQMPAWMYPTAVGNTWWKLDIWVFLFIWDLKKQCR